MLNKKKGAAFGGWLHMSKRLALETRTDANATT
jgi:hypothetical protein